MDLQVKCFKIGNIIITTEKQIGDIRIKLDSKEVWELFVKTVKEGKIQFDYGKK